MKEQEPFCPTARCAAQHSRGPQYPARAATPQVPTATGAVNASPGTKQHGGRRPTRSPARRAHRATAAARPAAAILCNVYLSALARVPALREGEGGAHAHCAAECGA